MTTNQRPWYRFYRPGTRRHIDYPRIPVFRLLEDSARRHPDLVALAFYQQRITYGELWRQVRRMANALVGFGLRKGDRVAIMLPNSPAYVIEYYGTLLAGGIVAQVNPLYTEREVEQLVNDCSARFIITLDMLYPRVKAVIPRTGLARAIVADLAGGAELGPEAVKLADLLAASADVDPDVKVDAGDVAVLQYTGGTTGVPKGAMLTHFNLVANVLQTDEGGDPAQPGEDRILTILPLFHSFGMTACMNLGLYRGARLVLLPRFEIDAVMAAIREHQITAFPGVPTMYVAVLNYPNAESYGIHTIKRISAGGAAMPAEVQEAFEKKFGASIGEGYGLSEASPVTHGNPTWDPALRKKGSIGIPVPDTDAKIVDLETDTRELPPGQEGELIISGPQVMKGYWNRPEETAAALRNGWLYTGDIAKMDEDGYFWILDRKKDLIIVSGFNVYPREIDEVLYEHPAVLEAATIGVPDPYRGGVSKAFVVLKPGQAATVDEIVAFCKERLAPFKVPKQIEFRDNLPKTAIGKILRRELAAEERRRRDAQGQPA